ncbi:MAG: enoyl-CoA hydratase/isomerase family protein [Betaproteobacteria bacterium]|nr:enoyl-CoA hydratase/isomerase family protein [Betaproteobacteria bacterium]
MTYQNIILEHAEAGKISVLTVNRPQALNALNAATLDDLASALARVAADAEVRVLLITGAGEKAFIAGADITAMRAMSALEAQAFSEKGQRVMQAIEALPIPVIALVNGYALGGGCELAMSCDWIIAAERAVFGQPEVNLGIPPGFGGTQRLSRLVGRARALELVVTGRQVKADEALRIGLVNEVVPPEQLTEKGLATARLIAAKAPVAVRVSKQAVQRGLDLDLANGCVLETSLFAFAFGTADRQEGMTAFVEKRAPKFEGK